MAFLSDAKLFSLYIGFYFLNTPPPCLNNDFNFFFSIVIYFTRNLTLKIVIIANKNFAQNIPFMKQNAMFKIVRVNKWM